MITSRLRLRNAVEERRGAAEQQAEGGMMIPSDATHTLAMAIGLYIFLAILWLVSSNRKRRNRNICPYCGGHIIVRGKMRVCLNPVCGAQWRI